jgi:hypothetical protein
MKALRILLLLSAGLWLGQANAERVYQQPDAFVAESFAGKPPAPTVLWLTGDLKAEVRAILDHDYPALRLRYWGQDNRSVWVLEEIGKESPITVGIVVENNRIAQMRVLVFRESRGWEVESPAFIHQYLGAELKPAQGASAVQLDRHIDGISGATLSVRALSKLSRLALLLHRHTPYNKP